MPIRQITIIGTGLIGGSFALALRKRKFAGRIVGCDRRGRFDKDNAYLPKNHSSLLHLCMA